MLNRVRVAYWKWRARRHYLKYCGIADEYDCGHTILQQLSARASFEARAFDNTMNMLRKLGEEVPSGGLVRE